MDVLIPTRKNPLWLARCLASLRHYYPFLKGECIYVESDEQERTWLGNMLVGLDKVKGPLVFIIQDDAQLMCLRPSWRQELVQPFEDDPLVAVSCMTATACGYPHQSVRMAMSPGPYYTTMFIPIAFAARVDALREALRGIPHDMYCDHAPSLNLLMAGYRLVMNPPLPVYHEGMQSNPRIYGGSDPKAFMDQAKADTQRYIGTTYPPVWVQHMESLSMIPMANHLVKTDKGIEVGT